MEVITLNEIDVILEGGPTGFPAELRMRRTAADEVKVKVPYLGGYEHFERTAESDVPGPVVYRWTGRTHVAE